MVRKWDVLIGGDGCRWTRDLTWLFACFWCHLFSNARHKLGTNRVSWQGLATMAYVWKRAWRCAWNNLWLMTLMTHEMYMSIRSVKLCFWIFHSFTCFTLRISCDIDNSCTMLLFQVLTVFTRSVSSFMGDFQLLPDQPATATAETPSCNGSPAAAGTSHGAMKSCCRFYFVFQDRRWCVEERWTGVVINQRNGQK